MYNFFSTKINKNKTSVTLQRSKSTVVISTHELNIHGNFDHVPTFKIPTSSS